MSELLLRHTMMMIKSSAIYIGIVTNFKRMKTNILCLLIIFFFGCRTNNKKKW